MPYNFGHVCAIVGILPTSVGFFQTPIRHHHFPVRFEKKTAKGTEFQVFGNNDRKEAWDSPTASAVARAKGDENNKGEPFGSNTYRII